MHESCLLALGSIKSLIIDKAASGKITFDMNHFLTTVLLVDLQQTGEILLLDTKHLADVGWVARKVP